MGFLGKVLGKFWHYFSNLLLIYGYYLLFLFFYDTFLRIAKPIALPLSLILTLFFLGLNIAYWYRDQILKRWRNA
ncbi:MAG TPA: hypothetical protein EYG91_01045 [Aquifex aeolicus]|nr:hypothetical protein [Aquifex aeolicus]